MTQNQVNKFCKPMTLSMSHRLARGCILLKDSALPVAEPGTVSSPSCLEILTAVTFPRQRLAP